MPKLSGKTCLIIGGTSGLSVATARRFQVEGATVVVTGFSPATVKAAHKEVSGIEVVVFDAGDTAAAKAVADVVAAKHGRIDVLFGNAGMGRAASIAAVEQTDSDAQLYVDMGGPYFLIRHVIPLMPDGGAIVLTSSVSGVKVAGGLPALNVYSATTTALRSAGRSMATELASRRIRVNTISFGTIATPIGRKARWASEHFDAFVAPILAQASLKRIGQAEEVAAAALFPASVEASYTTGVELFVDGGMAEA